MSAMWQPGRQSEGRASGSSVWVSAAQQVPTGSFLLLPARAAALPEELIGRVMS